MKKQFTEGQIVKILQAAANGNVAEICRKHGISEGTYYNWTTLEGGGYSVPYPLGHFPPRRGNLMKGFLFT